MGTLGWEIKIHLKLRGLRIKIHLKINWTPAPHPQHARMGAGAGLALVFGSPALQAMRPWASRVKSRASGRTWCATVPPCWHVVQPGTYHHTSPCTVNTTGTHARTHACMHTQYLGGCKYTCIVLNFQLSQNISLLHFIAQVAF